MGHSTGSAEPGPATARTAADISIDAPRPTSGIKVLDRAAHILEVVAEEPRTLAELCAATELPRATAHRLASALEVHHMLSRTTGGKWTIGPALTSLSSGIADYLIGAAQPIMTQLMELTGESVQLYRLTGGTRTCVAAQEPLSGLHNTVPVGSRLPLTAGSAAQVFLAYGPNSLSKEVLRDAAFNQRRLSHVRERGWAESVSEREPGLASVSTPVFDANEALIAALSISGPSERLSPSPGAKWAPELVAAARQLSLAITSK